ncbi:MAG: hypothetical protein HS117_19740 [Verrucomicrobiaceae bacterium]|nr:hypothetical protein [Verrucomicrobiaceae bacterium]
METSMQHPPRQTGCLRVAVLVILVIGGMLFYGYQTSVLPTREMSRMLAVRTAYHRALALHYEEHRCFPSAIDEVFLKTLQLGAEGSSQEDARAWQYHSEDGGKTFSLFWRSPSGDLFQLSGRHGQIEESSDYQRR